MRPRRTAGNWPTTEAEAVAEQNRLRERADTAGPGPAPGEVPTIAGVDVAYDEATGRLAAAAVVLDAETLEPLDEATATGHAAFPYIPGLLAFRELPPVLDALEGLSEPPALVVCDGYGLAHPRRLGLAAHLGVLTGIPSFGVAKTPFGFAFAPPGPERGASSPLLDGEEEVGRAAHPGGRQTGLRLGGPRDRSGPRRRPHPPAHPALPAAGDHPAGRLPLPPHPRRRPRGQRPGLSAGPRALPRHAAPRRATSRRRGPAPAAPALRRYVRTAGRPRPDRCPGCRNGAVPASARRVPGGAARTRGRA